MAIMLGSVLLNVGLNWIFIYGHLGSPALGLDGAGLATLAGGLSAHDSVLVIQRVKTGASAGFEVKPMRQPVIAQVLDAPSEMIVRSYMPGTCAMEKKSPA